MDNYKAIKKFFLLFIFPLLTVGGNDAVFVSRQAPDTMFTGEVAQIVVAMKNTGTTSWTKDDGFVLRSDNPKNNTIWGASAFDLSPDECISPGQTKLFYITIKAPLTAGVYNLQFRMQKRVMGNFGEFTRNLKVVVINSQNDAAFIVQSAPSTMLVGAIATVDIVMKNTGQTTWTDLSGFQLQTEKPQGNTTWGISAISLNINEKILPGQQKMFDFQIKAPVIAGTYQLQFRMKQNQVGSFGDTTITKNILVEPKFIITTARTVQLAQYTDGTGRPLTTTDSDPAKQRQLSLSGFTHNWSLGYVFEASQAAPQGTTELCLYNHFSGKKLTTTRCSNADKMTYSAQGYTYERKLGYTYPSTVSTVKLTTELCRYDNTSGHNLTTTICSGSLRQQLENIYGWTYREKLGYVYRGDTLPPVLKPDSILWNNEKVLEIHPSSELDRKLYIQRFNYPTELTPIVLNNIEPGKRTYLLPTQWTLKFNSTENLLEKAIVPAKLDLLLRSELLDTIDLNTGAYSFKSSLPTTGIAWKRNYNSIFSAHVVGPPGSRKILSFAHGENANFKHANGSFIPNTVKSVIDPNCYSGFDGNGGYFACWSQFSSFISTQWWPVDDFKQTKPSQDEGPSMWPAAQYSQSTAVGVYHPTSFVDGDTVYIYFQQTPAGGGWFGMSGAKATLQSNGVPGPFRVFHSGAYNSLALPVGFDKNNISNFYNVLGPPAQNYFGIDHVGVFFNVAKIKGTRYYASLEEKIITVGSQYDHTEILMRISTNPGDWSKSSVYVVDRTPSGTTWGDSPLTYPTFFNKDATSNYEIDPEDFFIVGNKPNGGYPLIAKRFSMNVLK